MSASIVLVCAVLASLAAGVLLAYGICVGLFSLFQSHARQIAQTSAIPVTPSTQAVEG